MRMLIATSRPADFTAFLAALTRNGVETSLVSTGQASLTQAKKQPPTLIVVDENLPDSDPFVLVARLMETNAAILTAVVSRFSPENFHEAGEGLGILTQLPRHPGADDAQKLLTALAPLVPAPADNGK